MGAAVGFSFLVPADASSESQSETKAPWIIEPLPNERERRASTKSTAHPNERERKVSTTSTKESMGKLSFDTSPSILSSLPSLGFSTEERIENERVQRLQQTTGSFFVHHAYNGFPTKARKQKDPLAPLWIEVSLEKLDSLIEENKQKADSSSSQKEIQIDMKLLQTVPTGIIIDRRGDVKIIFSKTGMTYELSAQDVLRAMTGPLDVLVPPPPFLKDASPYQLTLQWILPFPAGIYDREDVHYHTLQHTYSLLYVLSLSIAGITQKVEIQYIDGKKFTPKSIMSRALDKNNGVRQSDDVDGFTVLPKRPKESDWRIITTCMYESRPVDTFTWSHLQPGKCFYVRLRLWTHQGTWHTTPCHCD